MNKYKLLPSFAQENIHNNIREEQKPYRIAFLGTMAASGAIFGLSAVIGSHVHDLDVQAPCYAAASASAGIFLLDAVVFIPGLLVAEEVEKRRRARDFIAQLSPAHIESIPERS